MVDEGHDGLPPVKLCFDAGPLENQHRDRGVGRCAQQLLAAFSSELLDKHNTAVVYLKRDPVAGLASASLDVRFAPRSKVAGWTATNARLPARLTERWKPLETALLLPREVAATGADVFLSTDPGAVATSPAFRTVAFAYDLIPLRYPDQYLPRRAIVTRAIWAAAVRKLRKADHLIAISESTKADLIHFLDIPSARISVVPLAVDAELFRPISPSAAAEHVEQHFGISAPYFLSVGGFDVRKNLHALIDAFADMGDQQDCLLVFAGSLGKLGSRLRHEVEQRGLAERIRWLGYVPDRDLPFLYAASLALTYPSLYEGFGLPVLEAMSCGAPVLTSPLSSLPEVAGDAALFVDPRSVAEMRSALRRLASEPQLRAELRDRGFARAQRFSWARTADEVLRVCGTLVTTGTG